MNDYGIFILSSYAVMLIALIGLMLNSVREAKHIRRLIQSKRLK